MPCRAIQDGQDMVKSSDKMWSIGEGNGKRLQYSCLENPKNSMIRQEDITLKDELPRSVGAQYATGEEWRNNSRKNKAAAAAAAAAAAKSLRRWGQRENNAQLWMRLVIEVQYDAVENNTA